MSDLLSTINFAKPVSDIKSKCIDLTNLTWTLNKDTPGTAGMFLKSRVEMDGVTYYLKMSSYNSEDGVYGHESILELIASRLADKLSLPHIQYELWNAKVNIDGKVFDTWVSASEEYRVEGEVRLSLESYYNLKRKGKEDLTSFMLTSTFKWDILQMLVFDYIIANRDRHSNNIELLYNRKSDSYRLVPMFDHGCSLSSPLFNKWYEMNEEYYMKDFIVNNCIGSKSLKENLRLVYNEGLTIPVVMLGDDLFNGIHEIMGSVFCTKHLEMLKERYRYALDVLN